MHKNKRKRITVTRNCLTCKKDFKTSTWEYSTPSKVYCNNDCLLNRTDKKCSRCGILKPLSEWGKNKASPTGLQGWCIVCRQKDSKVYFKKNRERINERTSKLRIKRRLQLLSKLGKKCVWCGESRIHFLQFDHVNNDGGKERREHNQRGMTVYLMNDYLRENLDINRLQILCANCNFKKQYVSDRLLRYISEVKNEIGY